MMGKEKSIFYWAAAGNFLILGLPLIVAFTLTFVLSLAKFADASSLFFYVGIALMFTGWGMLVISKWDQVKRGDLVSWGITNQKRRLLYIFSYLTMLVGYLVTTFSGRL
jgi:hypothetical protein